MSSFHCILCNTDRTWQPHCAKDIFFQIFSKSYIGLEKLHCSPTTRSPSLFLGSDRAWNVCCSFFAAQVPIKAQDIPVKQIDRCRKHGVMRGPDDSGTGTDRPSSSIKWCFEQQDLNTRLLELLPHVPWEKRNLAEARHHPSDILSVCPLSTVDVRLVFEDKKWRLSNRKSAG